MNQSTFRIGHGYDVHRLVSGRKLILGGMEIPFKKGLDGHSDADVLIHAICDALLGAAALGDIGTHFPDTDNRFLDADSKILLKETVNMLSGNSYRIANVDSTVIAQRPKLLPYIDDMAKIIADICEIDKDCINIKATTEEHLGFTGNGEGISAHAVALIYK